RVMWGRLENDRNAGLPDLGGREHAMLVPILVMIFWMGMYSSYFLRPMDASVMKLMNQTQAGRVEYAGDLNTFPSSQRRSGCADNQRAAGAAVVARSASPIGRSLNRSSARHVFAEPTTPALQPAAVAPPLLCRFCQVRISGRGFSFKR